MSPTAPTNRRRDPRVREPNVIATLVTRTGQAITCSLQDLSSGGARFVTTFPLRVGERVGVRLDTDDAPTRSLAVDATVIRAVPMDERGLSVAVRFDSAPEPVHAAIHGVVMRSLERARTGSRKTVLVIDDEPRIRNLFERDLTTLGFVAISVPTPLDAVRCLIDASVPIQIALVDLMLGHSDGRDVLAYFADERPEIRRVVMSSERHDDLLREVASGRAHAQLMKPWHRASLLTALDACADGDIMKL